MFLVPSQFFLSPFYIYPLASSFTYQDSEQQPDGEQPHLHRRSLSLGLVVHRLLPPAGRRTGPVRRQERGGGAAAGQPEPAGGGGQRHAGHQKGWAARLKRLRRRCCCCCCSEPRTGGSAESPVSQAVHVGKRSKREWMERSDFWRVDASLDL